jgi:peroxiredoxin
VFQGAPQDVWISAEGQPKLRRIQPDLKAIAIAKGGELPAAGVDVKMTIDFVKWAYDEAPPAEAFSTVPPQDFEQVRDLFSKPAERLVGKSAPAFEAQTLDGQTFKLADQAGKIVVLDFWATWCHPCVVALPKVNETVAKYKSQGVVFQTVNKGDDPEVIREFLATQKLNIPVLLDPTDAVCKLFRADLIPLTVIIDKTGKIQVAHVGAAPDVGEELAKELDQILAGNDLSAAKSE